jgi:SAM-dependent methyltransferase
MTHSGATHPQDKTTPLRFLERGLDTNLRRLHPQRLLLISARSAECPALPELAGMHLAPLNCSGDLAGGVLSCRVSALPFEARVFDVVILHQLISDGREAVLIEAQRVLKAGGQLLVIGCGRFGGAGKAGPGLRAQRLCQTLRRRAFQIRQCEGLGWRGRGVSLGAAWQRPLLEFCELVLVRARHQDHEPVVTTLRFSRPGPSAARGAALDSLSRQAVL